MVKNYGIRFVRTLYSGNSGARDERRNWKFLRRTSRGTRAGVSQDESHMYGVSEGFISYVQTLMSGC